MRYRRGEGPEQLAAWREAAAQGDCDAMIRLAAIAARSPDDVPEAEMWLRSAAELGALEATHKLGVMLWRRGERDVGEELVHRAALGGYQDAIASMGQLCELRGDATAAEAWLAQVTSSGD